jgi:hypothetical protein
MMIAEFLIKYFFIEINGKAVVVKRFQFLKNLISNNIINQNIFIHF